MFNPNGGNLPSLNLVISELSSWGIQTMSINPDGSCEYVMAPGKSLLNGEVPGEAHQMGPPSIDEDGDVGDEEFDEDGPMCSTAEHAFRREACFGQ